MGRALRWLWLPPWRRAPFRTLRNPPLLLGVAVAAFVLGLAGGSRPMLASSVATETLRRDVEDGCRFLVGLQIDRQVTIGEPPAGGSEPGDPASYGPAGPYFDVVDEAIATAVGTIPGIGPSVVTVDGGLAQVRSPRPVADAADATETGGGSGDPGTSVLLASRTDADDHIRVLDGAPGPGVWLPDVLAENLEVAPGDEVTLTIPEGTASVPVAATYRDLRTERDKHWCSMRHLFETQTGDPAPAVALFEQDQLLDLLGSMDTFGAFVTWEHAPTGENWVLPEARRALGRLADIADDANNRSTPLGQAVLFGATSSDVVGSVNRAERTSTAVSSMSGPVALGTVGVAVAMLLAAARSWAQRRSQEVTVLALRGAGPGALGVKAVLELLPPMLVGAAAGVAIGLVTVRTVGPGTRVEAAAIADGTVFVLLLLLVALTATAAVVAAGVRRVGIAVGTVAASRRLWWEPVVLGLAAAAFYELQTRESSVVDDTRVDGLLLLFPILLLAGGAGLLARASFAARPLSWLARRLPTAGWLAARRLVNARQRAGLIATGAALAIGIVTFAGGLSSSLRATSYAKTVLGPGAEQFVRISDPVEPPDVPSIQGISTQVTRTTEVGGTRRGHDNADVLGVEPATFADGAFWDASFADRSLDSLLELLDTPPAGEPAPAIAIGDGLPDELTLLLRSEDGNVEVPVVVAARAEAFPGYSFQTDKPLVVVNREVLTRDQVVEHAELWIDDPSVGIVDDLAAADVPIVFAVRPAADESRSLLEPQDWATEYLEVIGLAAGLVTIAGLGLYFAANAAQRRLGMVFARQLGMPARRSAFATAVEVLCILAAGFVFGTALAWLAVRLVVDKADPLPNSPPDPLLRFDLATVGLCGLGVAVTTLVATAVIERRAARGTLPELLRHDR